MRTNCRGPQNVNKEEAIKWSTEAYHMLLDYAAPLNMNIVIENHGGVSNDPDWMVSLVKMVPNKADDKADWQSYWGSFTWGYY